MPKLKCRTKTKIFIGDQNSQLSFWCSIFSCTSFNGEAHSYLQEARLLACSEGAALPREQRLFLWQMFSCHLWILLQWEIGEMKIWSQQACNTYLSSLAKFLHYRLTCSSLGSRQNATRSIFFYLLLPESCNQNDNFKSSALTYLAKNQNFTFPTLSHTNYIHLTNESSLNYSSVDFCTKYGMSPKKQQQIDLGINSKQSVIKSHQF